MPPRKAATNSKASLTGTDAARAAMRQHASFFADANVAAMDQELTFAEFVDVLPAHLREQRPLADLISWFEMIDADGDGTVTLDEYFKWSISAASIVSGAGVVAIFKRYDADGSGRLDRSEFCRAAEDAGFGHGSAAMFEGMPKNPDGTVNYMDISAAREELHNNPAMKEFLCALAWNRADGGLEAAAAAGGGAIGFTATDPEDLRTELRKVLRWHTVRLSELFGALDKAGDGHVNRFEWLTGMERVLSFTGERSVLTRAARTLLGSPPAIHMPYTCHTQCSGCRCVLQVLIETFEQVDADASGRVSYEELDAWMKNREALEHREEARRKVASCLS